MQITLFEYTLKSDSLPAYKTRKRENKWVFAQGFLDY